MIFYILIQGCSTNKTRISQNFLFKLFLLFIEIDIFTRSTKWTEHRSSKLKENKMERHLIHENWIWSCLSKSVLAYLHLQFSSTSFLWLSFRPSFRSSLSDLRPLLIFQITATTTAKTITTPTQIQAVCEASIESIRVRRHSDSQSSSMQPQLVSIISPKLLPPKRRILKNILGSSESEPTLIWTSDLRTADKSYLNNCPLLNQMIQFFLNHNGIGYWYILLVCNQQHRDQQLLGRHYKYQDYWSDFDCSIVFGDESHF